ncbi:MAG: hypothetical protein AB1393_11390 [Candidatus Edwardsbacteria bacterium]
MKFFIPGAKDDREAQDILESIKKFAKKTTGWNVTDRKIFSIKFKHRRKEYVAEVGQQDWVTGETVIAILESDTFLVCTPNQGVIRNMPILVGKREVDSIVDFE